MAGARRDGARLAGGIARGCLAVAAVTAVLIATNLDNAPEWPAFLEVIPLTVAYAIAGGLIAGRQPRNPIGWLFLFISSDTGLTALADAYAGHHLPGWAAAAWLQTWSSYLSYPAGFPLLLMLFPSGRLPSRRWRPLLGLAVFAAASRGALEVVAGRPIRAQFSATALLGANPSGLIPGSV